MTPAQDARIGGPSGEPNVIDWLKPIPFVFAGKIDVVGLQVIVSLALCLGSRYCSIKPKPTDMKSRGPMNLVVSIPPRVISPFVSLIEVVGSNDIPI